MKEQVLNKKQKTIGSEDSSLHHATVITLTPLMSQYKEVKGQHPDSLLFLEWANFMNCSKTMRLMRLDY